MSHGTCAVEPGLASPGQPPKPHRLPTSTVPRHCLGADDEGWRVARRMATGQLKLPVGREELGPFMRVELAREPTLPSRRCEGAKAVTETVPDKHLIAAGLLERNQRRLATPEDQHTRIH